MTDRPSHPFANLVPTEQINPRTRDIDLLDTETMLRRINDEDRQVAGAVQRAVPKIAVVVDRITDAFARDGHLLYFGAGTSGRLGVLDASECPPTYGAPPDLVRGYIAGGDRALRHPVEGAEDSYELGVEALLEAGAVPQDVVIGISASGGAPYVLGVVAAARQLGCFTAAITCNPGSKLAQAVDQAMVIEVGPEVIAGSSRMKAGTAQKLVLNMLTTGAMIQSGKTYENLMVDVQPSNEKLRHRATRMVAALANTSEDAARTTLEATEFQVKPAVLMLHDKIGYLEAMARLDEVSGKLRVALKQTEPRT